MKRFFLCLTLCFVVFTLTVNNGMRVAAIDSGFSTEHLSDNEKRRFLTNANISLLTEEPAKQAIECFDVNESGFIALGHKSSRNGVIRVLSSSGQFQYGYTFNCSGNLGVEWSGDNLNIYFLRSDVLVTVNRLGEVIDIRKTINSMENNTYINHRIYSTERIWGDKIFFLKNDMGILNFVASSYSQLTVTAPTGEENILYDANPSQFDIIILFLLATIIVLLTVVLAIRKCILPYNK